MTVTVTDGAGAAVAQRARKPVGAAVRIRNLTKAYGSSVAVNDVSLEVRAGEFISLLGPSGSGKTTTMMAVAGFVDDMEGEIFIGDRRIDSLPPHRREVGVVFQHLALFPHMTVRENVAYPLRLRGVPRAEIDARVARTLDLVHMGGYEERLPEQLSGGQQQRVAFARAVIFEPKVLLLDEPLAALDKKLRESMQDELRVMHRELGITIIHVTHDQVEAMAVSDRIAVMRNGGIAQIGTPAELYHAPANAFVADFLGESTLLDGLVVETGAGHGVLQVAGGLTCQARVPQGIRTGETISLMLRPQHVLIGEAADRAANAFDGEIVNLTFQGDRLRCDVRLKGGFVVATTLASTAEGVALETGTRVRIGWNREEAIVFPR